MVWVIGFFAALLLVVAFVLPARGRLTTRQKTREIAKRAAGLSVTEQQGYASSIRELVASQYDLAYKAASDAGKNEDFAHQVGILRAVSTVLANGDVSNPTVERDMQLETVPFNCEDHNRARAAVGEYLVYKFFPNEADMELLESYLRGFKAKAVEDAKDEADPAAFLRSMLYFVKCDWQRLASSL